MKKILMVHSTDIVSGGEKISLEIIKGLGNQFEFTIFLPQKPSDLFNYCFKDLKIIYPLKKKVFLIIGFLRRLFKQNEFEIAHCHGTRAAFWVRLASMNLKKRPKIIYTLHGFHIIRKPFFLKWPLIFLEKIFNSQTDILICVSEADKNLVLKYKTILPEKIKVIKNGIDIKKFQITQSEIQKTKKELELENNFILCSIGRLHSQKDFFTVLKSLNLIISRIPNVKLLIVGEGPLRNILEEETRKLGLDKYVKFLGWRDDVPVLINLSDMVILSTNWEGLPLVSLETGAAKKPIIASDVEGVRETIINGKTGFLFKPHSAEDLSKRILELFESKELREKMGESAFEFVSKNFSKEKMIEEHRNLYLSILK